LKEYQEFRKGNTGHDLSYGIARIDFAQLVEAVDIGVGLASRQVEDEFSKIRHELMSDNVHKPEFVHACNTAEHLVRSAKQLEKLVKAAKVLHGAETRADIIWCNRPPESQLQRMYWEGQGE
jgi:hypothetical protein